jgi:ABC-type transport system involved in multi-copper enzyme maturation permease subunit
MGPLWAEWVKIRSVRSTYVVLAITTAGAVLAVLLAWYAASYWDGATAVARQHFVLSPAAPVVGWIAQVCLAILGVLAITSEYATGTIRTSVAAVPRRARLLAAKAAVVGAVSLVAAQAAVFTAFFASHWIIGGRPMRFWTAPVPAEVPVLLSWGVSAMVSALVGLGLGALLRSAAAAIPAVLVLWYLVPVVALHLPGEVGVWASALNLANLPAQLSGAPELSGGDGGSPLPPAAALAAMAGYVIAALGGGAASIVRRDV